MRLNTIRLSRLNLPTIRMSAIGAVEKKRDGNVNFIEIADEEVLRVLIAHGMSKSPLGLTTDDTEKITSFQDWFVGNPNIRYVELGQFPMLEDCNLECTFADVDFITQPTDEDGIMDMSLDDENELVSMAEIDEYLKTLK